MNNVMKAMTRGSGHIMSINSDEILVRVEGISKRFGAIHALQDVSLTLRKGEILGLAGHNGAGKSVLTKILGGIHKPDEGKIFFEEEEVKLTSTKDAQDRGFFVVPQELSLARQLSVADNIFIGRKEFSSKYIRLINKRYINEESERLIKEFFNISLDASKPAGDFDVVTQRIIQIVRCLRAGAKVIVFDETTAGLSQVERATLFKHIKSLSQKGIGSIFITHMISEILEMCDTVTALRSGKVIGTEAVENLSHANIIEMIVGTHFSGESSEKSSPLDKKLFSVKNLTSKHGEISDISFDLRGGEILGIFGLRDQGQTALLEAIYGSLKKKSGEMELEGQTINVKSPIDALRHGIAYLPERGPKTVFSSKSILENLNVQEMNFSSKKYKYYQSQDHRSMNQMLAKFNVRGHSSLSDKITNLSGGNRQKILLARIMMLNPKVLMLVEPTQGIDIGAKEEIRQLILETAKQGQSVIIVTAEIDDIIGVCNRVLIIKQGKIQSVLDANEENREKILEKEA
jgi:ABC-type sugar transport system ATPase subunit